MKIHGVKREGARPLWLRLKKHYCPDCSQVLAIVKNSKIVSSGSEEGKNFDFSLGDGCLAGNIKFIWSEFKCPACGKTYSIDEVRALEKRSK